MNDPVLPSQRARNEHAVTRGESFMDEEDSAATDAIAETRYTDLTHELRGNLEAHR